MVEAKDVLKDDVRYGTSKRNKTLENLLLCVKIHKKKISGAKNAKNKKETQ